MIFIILIIIAGMTEGDLVPDQGQGIAVGATDPGRAPDLTIPGKESVMSCMSVTSVDRSATSEVKSTKRGCWRLQRKMRQRS